MFRLFLLIILFLSSYATFEVYGQYRDPFAAKSKRKKIKSNNKKGLFVRKGRGKKLKKGRGMPTERRTLNEGRRAFISTQRGLGGGVIGVTGGDTSISRPDFLST